MKKEEIININKIGWNKLIKSKKQFANTSLPEYGPFLKRNENQINLFKNVDTIEGATRPAFCIDSYGNVGLLSVLIDRLIGRGKASKLTCYF